MVESETLHSLRRDVGLRDYVVVVVVVERSYVELSQSFRVSGVLYTRQRMYARKCQTQPSTVQGGPSGLALELVD